jgi:SAM-dependent methyltransferase
VSDPANLDGNVVWHDLECGGYVADLPLWHALAARHGGPVLDIGAGTGRVALELARAGHEVTALDRDGELLEALRDRAAGLPVSTVVADAQSFELGRRFPVCLVPMQTIQLLDGPRGRAGLLTSAREHLAPGGTLAIAVANELELFEVARGATPPLPDVRERDGIVFASRPTAVRADGDDGWVLERRREIVAADGRLFAELNLISLARVEPSRLEDEARAAGLTPAGRRVIAPTSDHVGSVVVMLVA